jgi:hypothetical protein
MLLLQTFSLYFDPKKRPKRKQSKILDIVEIRDNKIGIKLRKCTSNRSAFFLNDCKEIIKYLEDGRKRNCLGKIMLVAVGNPDDKIKNIILS